jgi:A/G-specific adenine glycosylase
VALGKTLVERHGGTVPNTRDELLTLPGIGPYAAGAVMSIGFGIPSPMVDGPTGRVLRRLGGIRDNGRAPYYDKRVWALAERLLPATGVREYQLALLDVAAAHCRPRTPVCAGCPLANICSYAYGL